MLLVLIIVLIVPGLAPAGPAPTHETLARGLAATLEESLQGVQGLSLLAGPSLSETLGQSLQRQLMAMIPRGKFIFCVFY